MKDAKTTQTNVDKVILVGGQTRTPAVQRHVEKVFGKKPSCEVNPDEVVSVGAALQGGVLQGELKEIVLLDVLPLSLGVESHGGIYVRLIDHNSTIPLKKSAIFTTVADNQSVVEVHVLQGERDIVKYNRSLAKFALVGIPPAPRGAPQIEVTFDIDANGIVSVSAKEKTSGKEQAIKVTPSTGLAKEEIDRMILEAKQFADSDRKTREATEVRNRINGLLTSVSRSFSEFGRLLDDADQEMVKNTLQKARILPADETNPSVLKSLHLELEDAAAKLTTAMFGAGAEMPPEAKKQSAELLVHQAMEDVGLKKPRH